MKKINVAVVGCGYVADDHLKAWRRVRTATVSAVVDLNTTLAENTAKTWGIPRFFGSLADVTGVGIDVVDLCTPPQTHANLAVQAMKAGHNVLIEKPMAMTMEDADKIVECQRETGLKAGVIHNWLFDVPVLRARSLVEGGYLGNLYNIRIEALNTKYDSMVLNRDHWCHKLQGGRFSEMLAHPIYLIRHFLGGEVFLASVEVTKIGNYEWMKSDELSATFRVGKKLAGAYASFNSSRESIFITLYGERAIIRLDVINATLNLLPKRKTSRFNKGFDSIKQANQLTLSTVKNVASVVSRRWLSGHDFYIHKFAENLLAGLEPPVTVEEGREVVKVLEETCRQIEKAERTTGLSG